MKYRFIDNQVSRVNKQITKINRDAMVIGVVSYGAEILAKGFLCPVFLIFDPKKQI